MIEEAARAAFEHMEWDFGEPEGSSGVLETIFQADNDVIRLHVQCFEELQAASIVAVSSTTIPSSHMAAVAQLLMKANTALTVGAFELHWEDSYIMFRATNLFATPYPGEAERDIIIGMTQSAITESDSLQPALKTILETDADNINDAVISSALVNLGGSL